MKTCVVTSTTTAGTDHVTGILTFYADRGATRTHFGEGGRVNQRAEWQAALVL